VHLYESVGYFGGHAQTVGEALSYKSEHCGYLVLGYRGMSPSLVQSPLRFWAPLPGITSATFNTFPPTSRQTSKVDTMVILREEGNEYEVRVKRVPQGTCFKEYVKIGDRE